MRVPDSCSISRACLLTHCQNYWTQILICYMKKGKGMEWNGKCVHRVFIAVQPGHGQNSGLMDRNYCFQNFCIVKLLTKKQIKDTPARCFNKLLFDHCLIYSTYFSKLFSSLHIRHASQSMSKKVTLTHAMVKGILC